MNLNRGFNYNSKILGWKWYDFIRFVRLPISIIIYIILSIIFLMQIITAFNIVLVFLTIISIAMLAANALIIYGFKNKKKYAVYLYFAVSILSMILTCFFIRNVRVQVLFRNGVICICEIIYFVKRWDYFT